MATTRTDVSTEIEQLFSLLNQLDLEALARTKIFLENESTLVSWFAAVKNYNDNAKEQPTTQQDQYHQQIQDKLNLFIDKIPSPINELFRLVFKMDTKIRSSLKEEDGADQINQEWLKVLPSEYDYTPHLIAKLSLLRDCFQSINETLDPTNSDSSNLQVVIAAFQQLEVYFKEKRDEHNKFKMVFDKVTDSNKVKTLELRRDKIAEKIKNTENEKEKDKSRKELAKIRTQINKAFQETSGRGERDQEIESAKIKLNKKVANVKDDVEKKNAEAEKQKAKAEEKAAKKRTKELKEIKLSLENRTFSGSHLNKDKPKLKRQSSLLFSSFRRSVSDNVISKTNANKVEEPKKTPDMKRGSSSTSS